MHFFLPLVLEQGQIVNKIIFPLHKASVTHSRFLMQFLLRPFPFEICQKSEQDPVIRDGEFKKLYLRKTRQQSDTVPEASRYSRF